MLPQFTAKLIAKTRLSDRFFLLSFLTTDQGGIYFSAGQYLILKLKNKEDRLISRLYSIASKDGLTNSFDLIIEPIVNGVASEYLINLKTGDAVSFQGPAGAFSFKKSDRPVVFLATGSGIAPIRSMILSAVSREKNPTFLFWGIQTKSQICFFQELKDFAQKHQGFKFFYCLSREKDISFSQPEDQRFFLLGHVDAVLKTAIANHGGYDYYLCGGRLVVPSLRRSLLNLGVSPKSVFFEKF